jgi:acetamidase/formamidase
MWGQQGRRLFCGQAVAALRPAWRCAHFQWHPGAGKFRVPANLHIGNIGLAYAWNETVNSIPPGAVGGNMDNK